MRAALGASRGRVVRYLLAESAAAGVGAVVRRHRAGVGGHRASCASVGADYFPRTQEIALDGPVVWSCWPALTVASALLFGLVPALHGTGGPVDESLRSVGRSSTGSLAVRRLRRVLVGSQFADRDAAARRRRAPPGQPERAAARRSRLRQPQRDDRLDPAAGGAVSRARAASQSFWDELERRVEALPGVSGVAFADGRPPNDVGNINNFDLEELPTPPGQSQPATPWVAVTPEYFRVLGLTLLEGRLLDERDAQRRRTSRPSSWIAPGRGGSFPTGAPSASDSGKAAARSARGRRWSASSAR